ncbi:hypothetical protein [Paraburkholderia sp. SIMBA_054]|uniref:hypothetical protein n=1 Tax=Paraburkholderia sp. SIMBA_054 TaxID=3085795 RepID=UPI00397A4415
MATYAVIAECLGWMGRRDFTGLFLTLGGVTTYLGCRYAHSGTSPRRYLVSISLLAVVWILYLLSYDPSGDYAALIRNALVAAFGLSVAFARGFTRQKRDQSDQEFAVMCTVALGVVAGICGLVHFLKAYDTDAAFTASVHERYGAELAHMKFEDINVGHMDGACGDISIEFSDGSRPANVSGLLPDNFPRLDRCISMRMRSGKLTMRLPDRPSDMPREAWRESLLRVVDIEVDLLRQKYALIEADRAPDVLTLGSRSARQ